MGLNFYWHHNPCCCCHRVDKIHIGKSSHGWKFLYAGHRQLFDVDVGPIKSARDWVRVFEDQPGNIRDEEGRQWNIYEFLAKVESKQSEPNAHSSYMEETEPGRDHDCLCDPDGYEVSFREFS